MDQCRSLLRTATSAGLPEAVLGFLWIATPVLASDDRSKAPKHNGTHHFEPVGSRAIHMIKAFDVVEDAGTPLLEDCVDHMPNRFTGTLKKVEAARRSARRRLRERGCKGFMARQ